MTNMHQNQTILPIHDQIPLLPKNRDKIRRKLMKSGTKIKIMDLGWDLKIHNEIGQFPEKINEILLSNS